MPIYYLCYESFITDKMRFGKVEAKDDKEAALKAKSFFRLKSGRIDLKAGYIIHKDSEWLVSFTQKSLMHPESIMNYEYQIAGTTPYLLIYKRKGGGVSYNLIRKQTDKEVLKSLKLWFGKGKDIKIIDVYIQLGDKGFLITRKPNGKNVKLKAVIDQNEKKIVVIRKGKLSSPLYLAKKLS